MNMATWLVSSVLAPQDTMHIVCSFTFFTSSCRFQRKCRKGRLSLNQKIGMELSTETPSKRRLSEFITVRPDVCCHIIPFLVSHCDCWNTLTVKTGEGRTRICKNSPSLSPQSQLSYIYTNHHKDTAECNSMLWNDTKMKPESKHWTIR